MLIGSFEIIGCLEWVRTFEAVRSTLGQIGSLEVAGPFEIIRSMEELSSFGASKSLELIGSSEVIG